MLIYVNYPLSVDDSNPQLQILNLYTLSVLNIYTEKPV